MGRSVTKQQLVDAWREKYPAYSRDQYDDDLLFRGIVQKFPVYLESVDPASYDPREIELPLTRDATLPEPPATPGVAFNQPAGAAPSYTRLPPSQLPPELQAQSTVPEPTDPFIPQPGIDPNVENVTGEEIAANFRRELATGVAPGEGLETAFASAPRPSGPQGAIDTDPGPTFFQDMVEGASDIKTAVSDLRTDFSKYLEAERTPEVDERVSLASRQRELAAVREKRKSHLEKARTFKAGSDKRAYHEARAKQFLDREEEITQRPVTKKERSKELSAEIQAESDRALFDLPPEPGSQAFFKEAQDAEIKGFFAGMGEATVQAADEYVHLVNTLADAQESGVKIEQGPGLKLIVPNRVKLDRTDAEKEGPEFQQYLKAIRENGQEKHQEVFRYIMEEGGAEYAAAFEFSTAAWQTSAKLLTVKALAIGMPGSATGAGKTAMDTLKHAAKFASFTYLTTEGDEDTRQQAAMMAFAYSATPAISAGMPTDKLAFLFDWGLNNGLTLATGQYKDAADQAKILAEENGAKWSELDNTEKAKYLAVTVPTLFVSDLLFSLSTRSNRSDTQLFDRMMQDPVMRKTHEKVNAPGYRDFEDGKFKDNKEAPPLRIREEIERTRAEPGEPVPPRVQDRPAPEPEAPGQLQLPGVDRPSVPPEAPAARPEPAQIDQGRTDSNLPARTALDIRDERAALVDPFRKGGSVAAKDLPPEVREKRAALTAELKELRADNAAEFGIRVGDKYDPGQKADVIVFEDPDPGTRRDGTDRDYVKTILNADKPGEKPKITVGIRPATDAERARDAERMQEDFAEGDPVDAQKADSLGVKPPRGWVKKGDNYEPLEVDSVGKPDEIFRTIEDLREVHPEGKALPTPTGGWRLAPIESTRVKDTPPAEPGENIMTAALAAADRATPPKGIKTKKNLADFKTNLSKQLAPFGIDRDQISEAFTRVEANSANPKEAHTAVRIVNELREMGAIDLDAKIPDVSAQKKARDAEMKKSRVRKAPKAKAKPEPERKFDDEGHRIPNAINKAFEVARKAEPFGGPKDKLQEAKFRRKLEIGLKEFGVTKDDLSKAFDGVRRDMARNPNLRGLGLRPDALQVIKKLQEMKVLVADKPAPKPKAKPKASESKEDRITRERASAVSEFVDKETGTESYVFKREDGKWAAVHRDTDANEVIKVKVFPSNQKGKAVDFASTLVGGKPEPTQTPSKFKTKKKLREVHGEIPDSQIKKVGSQWVYRPPEAPKDINVERDGADVKIEGEDPDKQLTGTQQKAFLIKEIDVAAKQAVHVDQKAALEALSPADTAKFKKLGNQIGVAQARAHSAQTDRMSADKPLPPGEELKRSERFSAAMREADRLRNEQNRILGTIEIKVPGDGTFEVLNTKEAISAFQKTAKSFPVRPPRGDAIKVASVKSKEPVKLRKRPTKDVDIDKVLKFSAATEEGREALFKPFQNGPAKERVSTDGRRMTIMLGTKGKTSVLAEGREYPKYDKIINGYQAGKLPKPTGTKTAKIDTSVLAKKLNQYAGLGTVEPKPGGLLAPGAEVVLFRMKDGSIEIAGKIPEVGEFQSGDISKGKPIVALNAKYLNEAMDFFRKTGNETVTMHYKTDGTKETGGLSFSIITLLGKNEYQVIMPSRSDYQPGPKFTETSQKAGSGVEGFPDFNAGDSRDLPGFKQKPKPAVDDNGRVILPMEVPEFVALYKALNKGQFPKVVQNIRAMGGRALGVFKHMDGAGGTGEIALKASIFRLLDKDDIDRLQAEAKEYAEAWVKMEEFQVSDKSSVKEVAKERFNYLVRELHDARLRENPHRAGMVGMHEVGHLTDWLPEKMIQGRGNILGRIASLKSWMKSTLPEFPGREDALTAEDRERLRKEASAMAKASSEDTVETRILTPKEILDVWKTVDSREKDPILTDFAGRLSREQKSQILKAALKGKLPDWAKIEIKKKGKATKKVKELYEELLRAEIKKRHLFEIEKIQAELEKTISWWHGTDEMPTYFKTSTEMYADALSVMFNNPGALQERAPTFYKAFFNWMDSKPEVRDAFNKIQNDIRTGGAVEKNINKLYDGFEEGAAARLAEADAAGITPGQVRDGLQNLFIDNKQTAYRAMAKWLPKDLPWAENPRADMEDALYGGAHHERYGNHLNWDVLSRINSLGLTADNFGEYLTLKRIILERSDIANVEGITPKRALDRLAELDVKWGTETMRVLEDIRVNGFWAMRKQFVVDPVAESGMMPKEYMDKMRDNDAYATFNNIEYMDNKYGTGTGKLIFRQTGSLKPIENPLTATIYKDIALIDAVHRNTAAKSFVKGMRSAGYTDIEPAKVAWNGKSMAPKIINNDKIGTITYLENGKLKGYYAPRFVADAFNSEQSLGLRVVSNLLHHMTQPFREMYVGLNYGFYMTNLARDFKKARRGLPGITTRKLAVKYAQSIKPAFKSAFNIPDPTVDKMLEGKMLISLFNPRGIRGDDAAYEAMLTRFGVSKSESKNKIWRPIQKLFTPLMWISDVGKALERVPKIAGYKYMQENFGSTMSTKEIAHIIRTQSGSPAFLRRGAWYGLYNNLVPFSNAVKEGWRAEGELVKARPAEYAYKTAKYLIAPKIVSYLLKSGIIGGGMVLFAQPLSGPGDEEIEGGIAGKIPKLKDTGLKGQKHFTMSWFYSQISDYDLANYSVMPLGVTADGKAVYLRFPEDENGRVLGGMAWKIMNNKASEIPAQMGDFMAGEIPNLHPLAKVGLAFAAWKNGVNYTDLFSGHQVFRDRLMFESDDPRNNEVFLKWAMNEMGFGIIHRFKSNDENEIVSELEQFLDMPIASNIAGRFLKVSDYGTEKKFNDELDRVRTEGKKKTLAARDLTQKITDRLKANEEIRKQWGAQSDKSNDMIAKLAEGDPLTNAELKLLVEKNVYIKGRLEDIIIARYGTFATRQLMKARNDDERILVVKMLRDLEDLRNGKKSD